MVYELYAGAAADCLFSCHVAGAGVADPRTTRLSRVRTFILSPNALVTYRENGGRNSLYKCTSSSYLRAAGFESVPGVMVVLHLDVGRRAGSDAHIGR
jgi:hypothetical protein